MIVAFKVTRILTFVRKILNFYNWFNMFFRLFFDLLYLVLKGKPKNKHKKLYFIHVDLGLLPVVVLLHIFLIPSLLDLHTNVFFSLFNSVITGFGIYEAIK